MSWSVYMVWKGGRLQLPKDTDLDLMEAIVRADIYKNRCPHNVYQVVNNHTGDIEYEI